MDSSAIAGLIGAGLQYFANVNQHAQAIGQGLYPSVRADAAMGGLANRAYSSGLPMLQGAMGLAGLDPMSMGVRAMTGAWGAGAGVMGAGMAGIGAMGATAGIGAMASYAGNQMYTGMQQQQGLGNMLRSQYGFMNANGTQGFQRQDVAQIGQTMRGMAHQAGPGGEVVGFQELAQLAGNMGKMGMSGGVRDAQEFSRKFKEMIGTLKSVATELNTTLEGAQQFLVSQKSSGMFRTADQLKFASQARGTAMAGGLALSEVTAMGSIGSQISRSVGGLGRQGAFGGMRAIGQIGSATQVGALSEEDIYNTTGLAGAEGRQAMASSMLEQTGRFLRGSKGRHFLASVAGKNGVLDESSVQNWMSGGMDVGETRAQGSANLNKIGRANFIRNEGRLRGAVMERFGALAPAMALSQWASGKGMDINNMDDRSMLFAQRQLGMGRDEVDSAMKIAQSLPEILQQQRQSAGRDEYGQQIAGARRGTGVEGAKRKIEQIREGVQGKLQQIGADLFTSGADMIEQYINKTTGIFERRINADADNIWQTAKMGGKGSANALSSVMGGGRSLGKGNGFGAQGGGFMDSFLGLKPGVSRGEFESQRDLLQSARLGASGPATKETSDFVEKNRDWIRTSYQNTLSGVQGKGRLDAFKSELALRKGKGDKNAGAFLEKLNSGSDHEGLATLASIEKEANIEKSVRLGESWELPRLGIGDGNFATERQGDLAYGKALIGKNMTLGGADRGFSLSRGVGSMAGLAMAPLMIGAKVLDPLGHFGIADKMKGLGGSIISKLTGGEELAAATGHYFRSEEGSRHVRGMMEGEGDNFEAAQNRLMSLRGSLSKHEGDIGKLSRPEQAEFMALSTTSYGKEFALAGLKKGDAREAAVKDIRARASKEYGHDVGEDELRTYSAAGREALRTQAIDTIRHLSDTASAEMGRRRENMRDVGLGTINKAGDLVLSGKSEKDIMKEVGGAGKQAIELSMLAANRSNQLVGKTPEEQRALLMDIQGVEATRFESIASMSSAEKKKLARFAAGTDVGAEAGESLMRENRMRGLQRSKGGGAAGGVGAIAAQLGLDLDKDALKSLAGKSSSEITAALTNMVGASSTGNFAKGLNESIEQAKKGDIGKSADYLARAVQADPELAKKLKSGKEAQDPVVGAIGKQTSALSDKLTAVATTISNAVVNSAKSGSNAATEGGGAPNTPPPGIPVR